MTSEDWDTHYWQIRASLKSKGIYEGDEETQREIALRETTEQFGSRPGREAMSDNVDQEPGVAVIQRHQDGTRTVVSASHLIRVVGELLALPNLDPDLIEADGTLRLDTAGEYRYRYLRHESEHVLIYERITQGGV